MVQLKLIQQNDELQHLTGSEPLTLDEEYQMQETWRDSADKCTFIVLKKGLQVFVNFLKFKLRISSINHSILG
jgi:hypothetical protein